MSPSPPSPTIALFRALTASLLSLFLAPLLAPALVPLPPFPLLSRLHAVSVRCLRLLALVAGIDAVFSHGASPSKLPPPLVRSWTSPLSRGRCVRIYDQPGRWMTDAQLGSLTRELRAVAQLSIGCVPTHRLFNAAARAALANRVVALVQDDRGPLAFSALVYVRVPGEVVVHLGLTMVTRRAQGQRLQSVLFSKALLLPMLTLRQARYTVTNIGASPAGFGNVCEYFVDCFPHFVGGAPPTEHHARIARCLLQGFRYEFGCAEEAVVEWKWFVVRGSNGEGGTREFVRPEGGLVSKHRDERCNAFVGGLIDGGRDELFQVATFDVVRCAVKYVVARGRRSE